LSEANLEILVGLVARDGQQFEAACCAGIVEQA
jgi:predicted O-linked N-acetylglucosamine transferase (SPINDLY family)